MQTKQRADDTNACAKKEGMHARSSFACLTYKDIVEAGRSGLLCGRNSKKGGERQAITERLSEEKDSTGERQAGQPCPIRKLLR